MSDKTPGGKEVPYNFSRRVEHLRRHWEKKFQQLIEKGLEKEAAGIYFEITKLSKEAIEVTFSSEDIFKLFRECYQQKEAEKLQNILKPRFFNILDRSIVTAGESGMSLFSNVLSATCKKLEQRLDIRKERLKNARIILYPKIKKIFDETGCCEGASVKIRRDDKSLFSNKLSVDIHLKMKPFDGHPALPMHLCYKSSKTEEIIENIEMFSKKFKKK